MTSFSERVAARAADVRVAQLVLSLLVLPFYVLGFAAAIVWLVLRWLYAAVLVGFTDVTSRNEGADVG